MTALTPLDTLYDNTDGQAIRLPAELEGLYGPLVLPPHPGRPYIVGNFVTTLDGVVALGGPGSDGGGKISGFNKHDRMVMGLLRAIADAVIVGAGTLRSVPNHFWTAQHIYPALSLVYDELRLSLGKTQPPLHVFITAHGEMDPTLPVIQSGTVPVLIVSTPSGAERLRASGIPASVWIAAGNDERAVSAQTILEAIAQVRQDEHGAGRSAAVSGGGGGEGRSAGFPTGGGGESDLLLLEGGPQLMGAFFSERRLDDLFLTLAPQIAGRDGSVERPGLVSGVRFAPEQPLWGELVGLKRGGSHLFLRYRFPTGA